MSGLSGSERLTAAPATMCKARNAQATMASMMFSPGGEILKDGRSDTGLSAIDILVSRAISEIAVRLAMDQMPMRSQELPRLKAA